ncbi:MAG: hypothetical protein RSC51_06755 [Oscillospiraceae bacterium]
MSQAKRYTHLAALTGRENHLDSAYHAAFYLLSYDPDVYEVACRFVTYDGIDFSGMKRSTRGFDERTRFVVDIAHNLFSYNSTCKATPFEISRLGYPLMEQVCNALYIAADQVRVVIHPDENQKIVMELDAEPYQKTKRTHYMLEQLQESMMADMQQDEATDLER